MSRKSAVSVVTEIDLTVGVKEISWVFGVNEIDPDKRRHGNPIGRWRKENRSGH